MKAVTAEEQTDSNMKMQSSWWVRSTNTHAVPELLVLKLAVTLHLKTRGNLNLNHVNKAISYTSL